MLVDIEDPTKNLYTGSGTRLDHPSCMDMVVIHYHLPDCCLLRQNDPEGWSKGRGLTRGPERGLAGGEVQGSSH